MMALILSVAKSDERIRAALLNGSRANPNAPKDSFQDYDVVFIVNDPESFVQERGYSAIFGEPLMVQMPETMRFPMGDGRFTYLTLYQDGSRIDLQLFPVENWRMLAGADSETIALLDKDGILPSYPPPSDSDYFISPPSQNDYDSCCNDFWWCLQNVAKGILRDELPYAMEMFNRYVRDGLHEMIAWRIGVRRGFSLSVGKAGKYFRRYLEDALYERYLATYADADYAHLWEAMFAMCGLFRELANEVAAHFGYAYRASDDERMTAYLTRLRYPDGQEPPSA